MITVGLPSSGLWSVLYRTRSTGEASTHLPVSEDQLKLRSTPSCPLELFCLIASSGRIGFGILISTTSPALLRTFTAHVSSATMDLFRSLFVGAAGGTSEWRFTCPLGRRCLFSRVAVWAALVTWLRTSEKVPSSTTSRRSADAAPAAVRMSSHRCSALRESPPLNRKLESSSMVASLGRPRTSCPQTASFIYKKTKKKTRTNLLAIILSCFGYLPEELNRLLQFAEVTR